MSSEVETSLALQFESGNAEIARNSSTLLRCARNDKWNEARRGWQLLRSQFELLPRNAAQFEKTNQRFLDQIIRTRRASGNANDRGPVRQPKM